MKQLALFSVMVLLAIGCTKDPVPPGPLPPIPPGPKNFMVAGKSIKVEGVVKEGTKVTASEAEKAVRTAVNLLEK